VIICRMMTNRELNKRVASHQSGHYESLGLKTISKNRTVVMASAENGNTSLQLDILVNVPQELRHNAQRPCLLLKGIVV
jgi:hypothetical protein